MKVLSILTITTILSFNLSAQKVDIYGLPILPKAQLINNKIDRTIKSITDKSICRVYQSGEIIFEIKITSIDRKIEEGRPVTYYFGIDKGSNVVFKGYNYNVGIDSFYNIRVERLKDTNYNQLVNEAGK